jgi:hypothetical protein
MYTLIAHLICKERPPDYSSISRTGKPPLLTDPNLLLSHRFKGILARGKNILDTPVGRGEVISKPSDISSRGER